MKKKLVFYFYITRENVNSEVYRVHYACLEKYIGIFDEVLFVISVDDVNDFELINSFEHRLTDIRKSGDIKFVIHQNDGFRESWAFKKYVVDCIPEDKFVFFGHSKGITNVEKWDKNVLYNWIIGMYFYNFNFMNEVEDDFIKWTTFAYGSFLFTGDWFETTRYKWFYSGAFFWLHSSKLYNYLKQHDIEIPKFADRLYAENFLGNIVAFNRDGFMNLISSHGRMWFKDDSIEVFYKDPNFISYYYPEHEDFDEFKKEILEKAKTI